MPIIRPETEHDFTAIQQVNRLAFDRDAEAQLVNDLRAGGYVNLSLIAELEGQIVGHILFSDLQIIGPAETLSALALAPVAVLPNYQRRGIGSQLIRRGLELCQQQGHRIVLVLGHPSYYPRFGFSAALARKLDSPYAGDSFMALELVAGALDGVTGEVRYAPPFAGV